MHNREPLTPALLWQSMKDFDLWPIYILGLNFQTPMSTPAAYLTLSLKGLGFGTFKTNLLVIPSKVFHVATMLGLTYAAEVFGELTFTALIGQIWALPFLVFINFVDINSINKWLAWIIMTAFLSYPNGKPSQSPFLSPLPPLPSQLPREAFPLSTRLHTTSTSNPSRLELAQLQHRTIPHHLGSSV